MYFGGSLINISVMNFFFRIPHVLSVKSDKVPSAWDLHDSQFFRHQDFLQAFHGVAEIFPLTLFHGASASWNFLAAARNFPVWTAAWGTGRLEDEAPPCRADA